MSLTKVTHPMISSQSETEPSFTEAGNTLYVDFGFNNDGVTTEIPSSKQYNYIGIRNESSQNNFEIGDSALVTGVSCYMSSVESSSPTSNMYAVIGSLINEGQGTTKALYGRAKADSTCTGVVMGAVLRTELTSGSSPTAWCLQIGPAGDLGESAQAIIEIDHEQGSTLSPGYADYGILQNANLLFNEAFIRGISNTNADFLRLQESTGGGGNVLFSVDSEGAVNIGDYTKISDGKFYRSSGNLEIRCGASGTLYFGNGDETGNVPATVTGKLFTIGNAATGYRLNFDSNSSASAGASAGYITIQVNGVDKKIEYFNVS